MKNNKFTKEIRHHLYNSHSLHNFFIYDSVDSITVSTVRFNNVVLSYNTPKKCDIDYPFSSDTSLEPTAITQGTLKEKKFHHIIWNEFDGEGYAFETENEDYYNYYLYRVDSAEDCLYVGKEFKNLETFYR